MTRGLEQLGRGSKKGVLPPVYVFVGADQFSQLVGVDRLRAELAKRADLAPEAVELLRFSGGETKPGAVMEALTDVSLFSRVKLIAVTEVQALSTGEWKQLNSDLKHHFGNRPPAPPGAPLLVVTSSEPNVRRDRGPARLSELQKRIAGTIRVEFPPPTPRELPSVLSGMAEEIGVSLSREVAGHLAARAGGTELRHYWNELAKLAAYAHPETTIDRAMIDAAASRSPDETSPYLIFDLAELIVEGRLTEVMESVRRLLASGETPLRIVAMLARHVRQLRRAAEVAASQGKGSRAGADASALAKEVEVPLFVAKKLLAQSRRTVPERLDDALVLCAETDARLKRTTETVPLFEAAVCRVTLLFAGSR